MRPWPTPPGELRKWKCLSPIHGRIPLTVNPTAGRARKPAWAGSPDHPAAAALSFHKYVMHQRQDSHFCVARLADTLSLDKAKKIG